MRPIKIEWLPASTFFEIVQSNPASASLRMGAPVAITVQVPRSNRSSRSVLSMPANLRAMSSCSLARMFTPNDPASRISSCAPASWFTQINSRGGSAETEQVAVAVSPSLAPLWAAVITVTPAANCRIPALKSSIAISA